MRQARAAATAALVLTFGITACSTRGQADKLGTANGPAEATAAMVYRATTSAHSADVQSTFLETSAGAKAPITSSESGAFSWSADRGELNLVASEPGLYRATTQELIDGATTYTRVVSATGPEASNLVLGSSGAGWTQSTVTGNANDDVLSLIGDPFLSPFGGAIVANQPDAESPTALLSLLAKAATATGEVGTQTLNGVETTHYRSLVPLSSLGGDAADKAVAELIFGLTTLPVDYWIDGSDRLRELRILVTVEHLLPGAGSAASTEPAPTTTTSTTASNQVVIGQGTMKAVSQMTLRPPITVSVTLRLSDYGVSPNLTIPSPSQITMRQSCAISGSGEECAS